jgi:hypothetical protein
VCYSHNFLSLWAIAEQLTDSAQNISFFFQTVCRVPRTTLIRSLMLSLSTLRRKRQSRPVWNVDCLLPALAATYRVIMFGSKYKYLNLVLLSEVRVAESLETIFYC